MTLSRKYVPGFAGTFLPFFRPLLALIIISALIAPLAFASPDANIKSRDRFFAVHFVDRLHGFIAGDKGLILSSKDGGATWERREQPMHYPLYDITFTGTKGWVVGGSGTILHSSDGGATWQAQNSGSSAALMSVSAINDRHVVAVGEGGAILGTSDGGATWTTHSFDMFSALPEDLIERGIISPNLYGVHFIESGHGWIVGDSGIVMHSSNGGLDWQMLRIGFLPSLYAVCFSDDTKGWAAGQNGLVVHTTDGGATWNPLELQTDQNLYSISFHGPTGIVVGENGAAFQSTDSGKTWAPAGLSLRPPFPWFTDACFTGAQTPTTVCVGERFIQTFTIPVSEKD